MTPMPKISTLVARAGHAGAVLASLLLVPALASADSSRDSTPTSVRASVDGEVRTLAIPSASCSVALRDLDGSAPLALVDTGGSRAPATVVDFSVDHCRGLRLEVRDLEGKLVRIIAEGRWAEGRHQLAWQHDSDAGDAVADGLYVVRLVPTADLEEDFTRMAR